ncbi:hypothetical protein Tco_0138391 [Tanacetum coccineum]
MDSTREISVEDQSNVETNETPSHDVLEPGNVDVIESDENDHSEYCVNCLRNDTEKLTEFLTKVNELKKNLDAELPTETHKPNNEDVFQKLLGVRRYYTQ